MTLRQVFGALLVFVVCPVLGSLPAIAWIVQGLTGRRLAQLGTGNISVSAAFYHGGKGAGILAVLSEAAKGVVAVLLARHFFPTQPSWELIALIALVVGRYWGGGGAGTTNVVWGYMTHDPVAAGLVAFIGGIGFTILRERQTGKIGILVLFPLITTLRHSSDRSLMVAAIALASLLAWIYQKIPDDLDLDPATAQSDSRQMFQFFRGDRALLTLDDPLVAPKVGSKAATLAHLRGKGYPVPMGWVLVPGDDPEPLLKQLQPSPHQPLIVRSSAVGEDTATASAAGLYESFPGITHRGELQSAIHRCFASYERAAAAQYRQAHGGGRGFMAVLIQPQVRGVYSGVAFSRDPIARCGDAVVIEALPGMAAPVVSGQVTPYHYRVWIGASESPQGDHWQLPQDSDFPLEGDREALPHRLIQQVAYLARCLEQHYQGIPQDVEWSFDGDQIWLLQTRPITTLRPIWTRKIAAEVIPGYIRPLTWSINRPLTCGVWGDLFTLVLGDRARGLAFETTATLHHSVAYFNASLLGELFQRMGLPPESLEFLTRGAKFSKPPLRSTLQNLPGLFRLARRELQLYKDFQRDDRRHFTPFLAALAVSDPDQLTAPELLERIEAILQKLRLATYYSILAPLGASLRRALAKVPDAAIDATATPEVAVVRSLQALAQTARNHFAEMGVTPPVPLESGDWLWAELQKTAPGQAIVQQFETILSAYDYLSEVGTDISVPTWREDPTPIKTLFAQLCLQEPPKQAEAASSPPPAWVQQRFHLKGRVTEIYSRLLAELRWSFLALESQWLGKYLQQRGDIFFLEYEEIRQLVVDPESIKQACADWIPQRQAQYERDRQELHPPFLVYGNDPPLQTRKLSSRPAQQKLQGIAASPGCVEGRIKVVRSLATAPTVDGETILVVPYTDSGWVTLLAQVGGLIAEVGGSLSHGAIVAREYQIPAVMDVDGATQMLHDGQRVRLNGTTGVIELLDEK